MSENRPSVPDHELFGVIGRGAFGEVWLARNVMGIWRAVKVIRRSDFSRPESYEREFEAIQRVRTGGPLNRGPRTGVARRAKRRTPLLRDGVGRPR